MSDTSIQLNLVAQQRHKVLNTLHTWLLVAGSLFLVAVSAWAIAGNSGLIYATIFAGFSLWAIRRASPQVVLTMYKAKAVTRAEFPQGHAIMDELGKRAGLRVVPKLFVIPSRMMNAFAVGRRDNAAVAVTDQLIRTLTARELTGVLAHEISHIRNEDIKVMALADMVSRFTSFMSTLGFVTLLFNITGFGFQVPWLAVIVMLAAPTVGGLLQMALSRTREFDADLDAAILTGDPDGLASALLKLERAQGKLWENMMLPGGRIPDPSILRSHPRTEDRVARLKGLKIASDGATLALPTDILDRPVLEPQPTVRPMPSPVPRIRPKIGLGRLDADNMEILSLLGSQVGNPVVKGPDAECEACPRSLNHPDGKPRFRLLRGGVYW